MIITRTPFRMSFFGGGTDMEDYFSENRGSVLSTTFDKYCYVNVSNVGSSLPSAQTSGVKMNATIQAASSIEEIVVYNEEDKEIDKIKVNTRVHVDHFDKELNKTKITYVVDDEVRTGYVETKYISIDGLKIEIIVAIVMSIIAIVIAIILIYNKKKNI